MVSLLSQCYLSEGITQELCACKILELRHPACLEGSVGSTRAVGIAATGTNAEFFKQLVDLGRLKVYTHLQIRIETLEVNLGQISLAQYRRQDLRLDQENVSELAKHLKALVQGRDVPAFDTFLIFGNVPIQRSSSIEVLAVSKM